MQPVSGLEIELALFLRSLLLGAGLLAVYDGIRIFRRFFSHGMLWISLEDAVYWTAAAIFFFLQLCEVNNGIIRGYILLGMALGAWIYYCLLSRFVMRRLSKVIMRAKKRLKKVRKAATIKISKWKQLKNCQLKKN